MDPILKIAFSLYNSPGAYALLLGSGVSRAAGILTGWELALNLVRKIAALESAGTIEDPEAWYRATYDKDIDYSHVLSMLTNTSTERMALLQPYFEPSPEEKASAIKVPTDAHRAIARLAKQGLLKVIITTNFDRLLETAFEDEGLIPNVIKSEKDLDGFLPLVHQKSCTIIKIHGDYRDTRIRNTTTELEDYPPELVGFIRSVLDDFGLIVCGWSGAWDKALRKCIVMPCASKFATYWLARGEISSEGLEVIQSRGAEVIQIESAESFFPLLIEKIEALSSLDSSSPSSAESAIASAKRYIADPQQRIKLQDLIEKELERTYHMISPDDNTPAMTQPSKETFRTYLSEIQKMQENLNALLETLSYYDEGMNSSMLTKSIERLSRYAKYSFSHLEFFPALYALYACGISALSAGKFNNLAAVLLATTYRIENSREKQPLIKYTNVVHVFDRVPKDWVPRENASREFTPFNNYLFDALRPVLKTHLPDDNDYVEMFDLFEYMLSLTFLSEVADHWCPVGCYAYRYRERFGGLTDETWGRSPLMAFVREGQKLGSNWELLRAGFFNGSLGQLNAMVTKHREFTNQVVARWN